ncbi:unnamed protein product, partial [Mesorhabditis belari]|uniref:RNA uridylyltransferase n=1 Tax=Mesorhabditis belari TaxID=2138241 RepID=A0AAF3FE87_9BILA
MSRCETCQVDLPEGPDALEVHESGKKHIRAHDDLEKSVALSERSVFLRNRAKHSLNIEELKNHFNQLGKVTRVIWKADTPDHAIFEFEEASTAKEALEMKHIELNQETVSILPRRIEFSVSSTLDAAAPDFDTIFTKASSMTSFVSQLDLCINEVQMKQKDVQERNEICERIENELAKYFANCKVQLFGSSITNLGITSSDMDATVCFQALSDSAPNLVALRDKYTMLTADLHTFRNRRLSPEEIHRLSSADRCRFVCKILNEIRKEVGWVSGQKPVLDARCPIVRFVVNRKILVDLSVDNELGYSKSAYLRDLLLHDASGKLRQLLLGFRIWALSAGLFEPPQSQHKGQFNAYMLYLMAIYFLQNEGLLPRFEHSATSRYAADWRIDYKIGAFNLENQDLVHLFQRLFAFWVQFDVSNVVSLHTTPTSVTEYKSKAHADFKYGHLNLEDPIEKAHNVCQNLSQKMFSKMRSHMMLGLASLKKNKNSFVALCTQMRPESRLTNEEEVKADAKCQIELGNKSLQEFSEELLTIFEEVLQMQKDTNPTAKRVRLEEEGNHEYLSLGRFALPNQLWIGRRAVKKQLARAQHLSGLKLEKEVSRMLLNKKQASDATSVLIVNVALHLINEKFVIGFSREEGNSNDLTDMAHFLQVLLPTLLADPNVEEKMEE